MLPAELRAARGLLGWTQTELSDQSGVAVASIRRFEIGATGLTEDSMKAIVNSIRRAGVGIMSDMDEGIGVKTLNVRRARSKKFPPTVRG
jgi:transcriptional regulator with XRE-family HTH domain